MSGRVVSIIAVEHSVLTWRIWDRRRFRSPDRLEPTLTKSKSFRTWNLAYWKAHAESDSSIWFPACRGSLNLRRNDLTNWLVSLESSSFLITT